MFACDLFGCAMVCVLTFVISWCLGFVALVGLDGVSWFELVGVCFNMLVYRWLPCLVVYVACVCWFRYLRVLFSCMCLVV